MATALIGHTGFVGGNLARQARYDDRYRSTDIEAIAGRRYELVVCAGAPGAKWIANQRPDEDRAAIARLLAALAQVEARRFVLISTIDVHPRPVLVDEDAPIDAARCPPYGRHRLELEQAVRARFPSALVVRLPGLYGPGLKKNVVYDFLNENRLDLVHPDGVFQFYDLARLTRDVETATAAGLGLVHLVTEPVSVRELARDVFGRELENRVDGPAPRYDVRTRHARAFGRPGPWLATKDEVLAGLRGFVRAARSGAA